MGSADTATYRQLSSDKDYMDSYKNSREKSLSLGLDLQGGMFVTLQVAVEDVVRELAGNPDDPSFDKAIKLAKKRKVEASNENFIDLFYEEWKKLNPGVKLAALYDTPENPLSLSSPDEEVVDYLKQEAADAIQRSFSIIRTRIDQYGVNSPTLVLQKDAGRILVELPGVKDPERIRQLLIGTANLEFFETYDFNTGWQYMMRANEVVKRLKDVEVDSAELDSMGLDSAGLDSAEAAMEEMDEAEEDSSLDYTLEPVIDTLSGDTTGYDTIFTDDTLKAYQDSSATEEEQLAAWLKDYPMLEDFSVLPNENIQAYPGTPVMGYMNVRDTHKLNRWLHHPEVRDVLPSELKYVWGAQTSGESDFLPLIAVKTTIDGGPVLEGDRIENARQDFSTDGRNEPIVTLTMDAEGSQIWAEVTGRNVERSVAIVMDNLAYSWPRVNNQISGGRTEISGGFALEEAEVLATLLNAGKLPVEAKIQGEDIVGPTLGEENINDGMVSFIIAFIITVLFMVFYYSGAGLIANVALLANLFFILGVSSAFNVVLTLPGIAAIVLTMGMAVDANVLIFERIREEMHLGKSLKAAITSGFRNAFSSVMDANITTFLTGVVLFAFGVGPIRGFAVNLMIGIATSLISALFLTRLILDYYAEKGGDSIKFGNKFSMNAFRNINIAMTSRKKLFYGVSGILVAGSIISMVALGFKTGVDFQGGRQYRVEVSTEVSIDKIRNNLTEKFDKVSPVIKTIGGDDSKLLITTSYKVDDQEYDEAVKTIVLEGIEEANPGSNPAVIQSTKVGPTVAADIKRSAVYSVIFSLLIVFLYILIRFRKWQYSLGALAALVHDVAITLGIFSVLGTTDVLPFSIDIDQAFIAAILTIVGYSINDTVVVFDRIRENLNELRTSSLSSIYDLSINQTISRTLVTSLTTLITIVVLFTFGGETIKGFMFALLVGIIFGTYSSVFVASPIAHDLIASSEGTGGSDDAQKVNEKHQS